MSGNRTTIAIQRETADRLGKIGRFNESYDDVIRRLLDARTVETVGNEA